MEIWFDCKEQGCEQKILYRPISVQKFSIKSKWLGLLPSVRDPKAARELGQHEGVYLTCALGHTNRYELSDKSERKPDPRE